MRKIVKLTESDLNRIVRRVIKENDSIFANQRLNMGSNFEGPEKAQLMGELESIMNKTVREFGERGLKDKDILLIVNSWAESLKSRIKRGRE
jgi:hypothetical protein